MFKLDVSAHSLKLLIFQYNDYLLHSRSFFLLMFMFSGSELHVLGAKISSIVEYEAASRFDQQRMQACWNL